MLRMWEITLSVIIYNNSVGPLLDLPKWFGHLLLSETHRATVNQHTIHWMPVNFSVMDETQMSYLIIGYKGETIYR